MSSNIDSAEMTQIMQRLVYRRKSPHQLRVETLLKLTSPDRAEGGAIPTGPVVPSPEIIATQLTRTVAAMHDVVHACGHKLEQNCTVLPTATKVELSAVATACAALSSAVTSLFAVFGIADMIVLEEHDAVCLGKVRTDGQRVSDMDTIINLQTGASTNAPEGLHVPDNSQNPPQQSPSPACTGDSPYG